MLGVKPGCFRHRQGAIYRIHLQGTKLTYRAWNNSTSVPAAPAVDIGGIPSPVDTDAPLLMRLHERCTTLNQPFSWSSAPEGLGAAELQRQDGMAKSLQTPLENGNARHETLNAINSSPAASEVSSGPPRAAVPTSSATLAASAGSEPQPGLSSPLQQQQQPLTARDPSPTGQPPAPQGTPGAVAERPPSAGAVVEVDEYCAETHPGSLCCTTTAVEKDATSSSCVVTLRTTVKLTDSRLHVAPSELEELAWLAARDAASAAVSALNRQCTALLAGREERHRFVCHMLQNGTIRDAKRSENEFGHVSYLVTLEDKATGRRMRAAFKPRVEGDCEGWHRVPVEVAAYQLSLLLGMDLVPPAVMRGDCDVDWTNYPAGGAFIYWCGNARQLNTVPMHEWSVPSEVLLSDTRILDVLIQNSDRHAGHFLYAEHWADGDYTPAPQPQGGFRHSNNNQPHQSSRQPQQRPAQKPAQQGPSPSSLFGGGGGSAGSGASPSSWWVQFLPRPPAFSFTSSSSSSSSSSSPPSTSSSFASATPPSTSTSSPPDASSSSSSPPPLAPSPASSWRGRMRPVLIDHAAGFRHDAFVCLDHENAFMTGPTRRISARTYLRLRFLDAPSLRAALGGAITDDEIAALLARRDSILAFFDGLVAEQGYDKVVLDA